MAKTKTPTDLLGHTIQSGVVPGGVAIVGSPLYTAVKQVQNNAQLGTNKPIFGMAGLGATTGQMITRLFLRTGPVPVVQNVVKEHCPENIDKKTAQNIGTATALTVGDTLNTPAELLATKNQSAPTGTKVLPELWQRSTSPLSFVQKLYGIDGRLKGGATLALGGRTAPFLTTLVFSKSAINDYMQPKTLGDRIQGDMLASVAATATNVMLTPLSAIAQKTMRYTNPCTLQEAWVDTMSKGLPNAYRGAVARVGVTWVGAAMTALTLTGQQLYTDRVINQRTDSTRAR